MAQKRFNSEFKAKVALEAIQGDKTVARLSSQYKVSMPPRATTGKSRHRGAVGSTALSAAAAGPSAKVIEAKEDRLYHQIGTLQVEVDWLRKKSKTPGLL